MGLRKEEITIGDGIALATIKELKERGRKQDFENREYFNIVEKSLSYRGETGTIRFYFDGFEDHLVFSGFDLGPKWEKLKRSIKSLRKKRKRGTYSVTANIGTKEAEIRMAYRSRNYTRSRRQGLRAEQIWQDLQEFLPKKPGLVKLGEPVRIREFTLQDLLVKD